MYRCQHLIHETNFESHLIEQRISIYPGLLFETTLQHTETDLIPQISDLNRQNMIHNAT